jgi:signal peptidase I
MMSALAIGATCLLALLATCGLAFATLPRTLMIITVDGSSMSPTYKDQQRLLVRRSHRCRRHDVIVFTATEWRIPSAPAMLVKRVAAVPGDKIPADMTSIISDTYVPTGVVLVRGDNCESLDSRRLGYVTASAITGVVLMPLAIPEAL